MTAAFRRTQQVGSSISGPYSGLSPEEAIAKMAAFAEQKGFGRARLFSG